MAKDTYELAVAAARDVLEERAQAVVDAHYAYDKARERSDEIARARAAAFAAIKPAVEQLQIAAIGLDEARKLADASRAEG